MTSMDIDSINEEAREMAEAHSKQGTFSFIDRLQGRNYPTEELEIFLDEAEGKIILDLKDKLKSVNLTPEEREAVERDITLHSRKAHESRYILKLQGISVEEYDSVVDAAKEAYPYEYTQDRHPLTAEIVRDLIPNDDREQYFRTHLWSKFFQAIVDKSGNVDSNMTPEFVAIFLKLAPVSVQAQVGIAVHKLRMVTNWMDEIQGEDFFPKS